MWYKSLGCKKRTDSVLDTGNHDLLASETLDADDDDEYGYDHEDDYDAWQCNGEEGDGVNDDIGGSDEIVKRSGTATMTLLLPQPWTVSFT